MKPSEAQKQFVEVLGVMFWGFIFLGFRVFGLRVLGLRLSGLRVLGLRVLGFRVVSFRVGVALRYLLLMDHILHDPALVIPDIPWHSYGLADTS